MFMAYTVLVTMETQKLIYYILPLSLIIVCLEMNKLIWGKQLHRNKGREFTWLKEAILLTWVEFTEFRDRHRLNYASP